MINIPFDPMIFSIGPFIMSWHGFLSFIGVVVAIYIVVKQANKLNIDEDIIYNTASWGIIGGIIGARFVHIADNLDYYSSNPIYLLYIWKKR